MNISETIIKKLYVAATPTLTCAAVVKFGHVFSLFLGTSVIHGAIIGVTYPILVEIERQYFGRALSFKKIGYAILGNTFAQYGLSRAFFAAGLTSSKLTLGGMLGLTSASLIATIAIIVNLYSVHRLFNDGIKHNLSQYQVSKKDLTIKDDPI